MALPLALAMHSAEPQSMFNCYEQSSLRIEHLAKSKWVARVINVENRETIQGHLVEVSDLSSLALMNVTLTIFVCNFNNKYFLVIKRLQLYVKFAVFGPL